MGCTSFLYSGLLILSELVIFRNLLPGTTYVWVFCFLKKNQNAPRPSEHPPVMGEKCQNV